MRPAADYSTNMKLHQTREPRGLLPSGGKPAIKLLSSERSARIARSPGSRGTAPCAQSERGSAPLQEGVGLFAVAEDGLTNAGDLQKFVLGLGALLHHVPEGSVGEDHVDGQMKMRGQ